MDRFGIEFAVGVVRDACDPFVCMAERYEGRLSFHVFNAEAARSSVA